MNLFKHTPCPRCGKPASTTTCSRFNTEMICIPCEVKETHHPDYQRAYKAEMAAVRAGNYNFPGIGKPADL